MHKKMKNLRLFLSCFVISAALSARAQEVRPDISPTAVYTDDDGLQTETTDDLSGQAPLTVTFRANPTGMDGLTPLYEWHFRMEGEANDLLVRYEEDTEYTFTRAGTTIVTLQVNTGVDTVKVEPAVIRVTISESKLSFPNAFSPNGDDVNDIYRAKEHQSLVSFHAYIFNRWGQKLYEWTDPAEGWDGTYRGKDVAEGVYFVLVEAKGADGREYNIRKDVNLLRGKEISN